MEQKTILVVYSNSKVNKKESAKMKRYAFNTTDDIKVGDTLASDNYDTMLQVVKVLDRSYKYYNASTGQLSDEFNSTSQWEIRNFVVRQDGENDVYGVIVTDL